MKRIILPSSFALLSLGVSCKEREQQTDSDPTPAKSQTARSSDGEEVQAPNQSSTLKDWLDPKAGAAAWSKDTSSLDTRIISLVYGLPPNAADLLSDAQSLDDAWAATLGEQAQSFLGTTCLSFRPGLAPDTYILRSLNKKAEQLNELLRSHGFVQSTQEGFSVFAPNSEAFPWRVVVLDAKTLGFFPANAIGSTLDPFTAGRDYPASELEKAILEVQKDSSVILTVHAGGPTLHLDVSGRIESTQFILKKTGEGGLDGQVVLKPSRSVTQAAKAMEEREYPEENLQVQKLIEDAAFTPQADVVMGRLQVTSEAKTHFERRN